MKEVQQYGIVLRTTPWRDADILLTLLTPELGRITAAARSARRNQRRFTGSCDLLDCGRFVLRQAASSGHYQVVGIEERRSWPALREDLSGFVMASYCVELTLLFALEEDPEAGLLLRLLLRTLQGLERERAPETQLALCIYFHLAILRGAGLQILDHPTQLPHDALRTWFSAMNEQDTPIAPFERRLLQDGLRSLYRFTTNETGTELRSFAQLMRPEILRPEMFLPSREVP